MSEKDQTSQVSEYTALNMLNFGITEAVIKKTNFNFKVDIPYEALAKSCGLSEKEVEEFVGTALRVDVNLKWVEDDQEMDYGYE